uniref:L10-interacting MYB domain-containing protein-like n=1 Tax=Erigeron canadensis TaxID=72917 RepID=UPI001CB9C22A|nr:L10-interacting MYB domain-containing protein-like [Erigeron canadensis]XP_043617192.1 L10-interacting MYB domain-containing protein-like [Erigeron canadensis]
MCERGNIGVSGKRELLVWTPKMDSAFIQAMLREQDKGNKVDGTFTTKAYENMVEELSRNLNQNIHKRHLQNRLKTIKKHFLHCYDLFGGTSLSGFTWNPKSNLIEAEEELWEELIANKPDAAIWKTKPFPYYNEIYELFSKDRVTGTATETAKERKRRMGSEEERIEIVDEIDQLLRTNDINFENFNNDDDIQVTLTSEDSQENPSKSKKSKIEEQSDIALKIIGSIEYLVDAMKECTKAIVGSRPRVYSEGEIFKELEHIGIGKDVISKAYLFLVRSPENTRALFGCPPRMRLAVLKEMMGSRV